jgi:hypothetical protein
MVTEAVDFPASHLGGLALSFAHRPFAGFASKRRSCLQLCLQIVAAERLLTEITIILIGLIGVPLISLVCFVTPNYTTRRSSQKSVMTGEMSSSAAYHGTLKAAFCLH